MTVREFGARANRLQNSLSFKVAVSLAVLALAATVFVTYAVRRAAPPAADARVTAPVDGAGTPAGHSAEEPVAADNMEQILRDVLAARDDPASMGIGLAVVSGVALVIIWIGLALTYGALLLVAALVAVPLAFFGAGGAARLVIGVVALTASFTALMQGARFLLSGSGPVRAIARNVLAEAVRMNVSLVFIVMLVVGLATLPGLLTTPTLRYRVQAFLQYSTSGAFWIIALLVVVFGVATVAFEQRDKQIWQTMTKPVAAWQYLLGKWLGITSLAGVLLAVSCSGIFLFTEYLRQQPALGEDRAQASSIAAGRGGDFVSQDRYTLETEVLVARQSVKPTLGRLENGQVRRFGMQDKEFEAAVQDFIAEKRKEDPQFATTASALNKVRDDLFKGVAQQFFTIEPMGQETYIFEGLGAAKASGVPLMLRYKIQSGENLPNKVYKLTFIFGNTAEAPQEVPLDQYTTLRLRPEVINEFGRVEMIVVNGALLIADGQVVQAQPNEYSITFPPGGMELSYAVGGYRANFVRVALVLWVKLGFLAMLAVTAATFLSFPVAVFVSLCAFMGAESSGYLSHAMEYWSTEDKGHIQWFNLVIEIIAKTVIGMFKTYTDLRPTQKLVDGLLLSWGGVAWGMIVLGVFSSVLYGIAVLIFRRRELATYSGQ
ncbi:MAG: hypothetical protein IT437_12495 [Phycisphaerales bacterium]|nr:hypothetical protein [Phycisphaerales bacterium]